MTLRQFSTQLKLFRQSNVQLEVARAPERTKDEATVRHLKPSRRHWWRHGKGGIHAIILVSTAAQAFLQIGR